MRSLITRFANDCRKCGTHHPVGSSVIYEKRVGIFCPACAPTATEEIRAVRQEGADRRADRFDGWAKKREVKAEAQLNSFPEIRHDWAFITQPGHIPFRSRMIASDDRAQESLQVARGMRAKARSLRHVVVFGDAERRRQEKRDRNRAGVFVGLRFQSVFFGPATVTRVNPKSASAISGQGYRFTQDLAHFGPPTDPWINIACTILESWTAIQ